MHCFSPQYVTSTLLFTENLKLFVLPSVYQSFELSKKYVSISLTRSEGFNHISTRSVFSISVYRIKHTVEKFWLWRAHALCSTHVD